ncbi:hypothetical protein Ae201684P_013906 [Aphanomyces euteiches]|uniref:Reverse transcriptase Ty1/copia-type domain-containing protein n=1 Tax=Aphanomyces euteiches TaxID=100861 RepID=A0A6G0WLE2_9STRA|nr:hypothetical protein Ae201684_013925 [Aphanomyces euteiches]KAH9083003.1 hypothetical protein Ae201684P_013906 [Aphanomyces euteiches]
MEYDQEKHELTMTQETYFMKILERFGMTNCHGYSTPEVDDRDDLWHDENQPTADQEMYRSMVGSLMYLITCTRPDISHAVQRLSRHLHDPRMPHFVGAKRVLRYIKHTIRYGLTFKRSGTTLAGYSDASWATRPDCRSTSGLLAMIGDAAVSWRSARQRVVALSTCEAEYIALVELAKEVMWLRGVLKDVGMSQDHASVILCDNKAAIATAESLGVSNRSNRLHFVRSLVAARTIAIRHVGTANQLADVFTKVGTRNALDKFKDQVMAVGCLGQSNNGNSNHETTPPSKPPTSFGSNTGEC